MADQIRDPKLLELYRQWEELEAEYHAARSAWRKGILATKIRLLNNKINDLVKSKSRRTKHQDLIDIQTGLDRIDLIHASDPKSRFRAARVTSRLVDVRDGNTLVYQSNTEAAVWTQFVQINARKMINKFSLKKAIDGDLYAYCNCPAFQFWGYQYISTTRRVIIPGYEKKSAHYYRPKSLKRRIANKILHGNAPGLIFPRIRNPQLRGCVCKHLVKVFAQMPRDIEAIFRMLNQ